MKLDWNLSLAFCKVCMVAALSATPAPSEPPTAPAQAFQFIPNESQHLPTLKREIEYHWPSLTFRAALAGQVQQETCPSLRSKKCWSPTAELKTEREYGFGLGQLTVTEKFDNFKEAKKMDKSMVDWTWENRYRADYQLRTLVLMDRFNWGKFTWAATNYERMAFSLVAYNGGIGGVLSDRGVCRTLHSCDESRWFGHVEHTSKKAKVATKGYGKSFFEINREYPRNILGFRKDRYLGYFAEDAAHYGSH